MIRSHRGGEDFEKKIREKLAYYDKMDQFHSMQYKNLDELEKKI